MKGRNASVILLLRYCQLVMQKLMQGRNASVILLFKQLAEADHIKTNFNIASPSFFQ
jgi:hypothetical protein